MKQSYCGICAGKQLLTPEHSRSVIHRANINRLPPNWHTLDEKFLRKLLRDKNLMERYMNDYYGKIGL
jgi:hypothetical protein